MADISKITLPNGSKYNIKDSTARTESVTSASISGSGLYISRPVLLIMTFRASQALMRL